MRRPKFRHRMKEWRAPAASFTAPLIGPAYQAGLRRRRGPLDDRLHPRNLNHLTPSRCRHRRTLDSRTWSEQTVVAYEGLRHSRLHHFLRLAPNAHGDRELPHPRQGAFADHDRRRSRAGQLLQPRKRRVVRHFHADYGFHGTYWHQKFGQPMSHGCINMTNADAKWLFDWAGPSGTASPYGMRAPLITPARW